MPGLSVADVGRLRTGNVIDGRRQTDADPALLADARGVIDDLLGPQAAAEFDAGTDAVRRRIVADAGFAMLINDKELQQGMRDMGSDMRGATLNALASLQTYDTLGSEALQAGLRRALTVKIDAPVPDDGSPPDRARTALETELQVLEAELYQANRARMRAEGQDEAARTRAEEEHKLVTGRIARAMVVAAREASGEVVDDSGDVQIGGDDRTAVVLTEEGRIVEKPRTPPASP